MKGFARIIFCRSLFEIRYNHMGSRLDGYGDTFGRNSSRDLILPKWAKPCYKGVGITSIAFRRILGYSVCRETGEKTNPVIKEVDHG
jgi:hypothetical protein